MTGPLSGVKVVEIASLAPAPFGCMVLADLGADVLRVERAGAPGDGLTPPDGPLDRGKRNVKLNLKDGDDLRTLFALVEKADVFVEGFRPGVAERLGIGPADLEKHNPRLIYGRMTGWGQQGPLSSTAGHDINYIALTGALHAIGRAGQPPAIPINLVGDFGGGTLYLVMGILAALYEMKSSGQGQVVDAAMVDGVASLMTQPHGTFAAGMMTNERGTNITDSGAPFYDVYECSDGKWVAIGAVEKKFYATVLRVLELDSLLADQWNRASWGAAKTLIAQRIKRRTRDDWCAAFEGTESCFAPVLTLDEAPQHPHLRARGTYVEIDGITQPAPAPRFSRSIAPTPQPFRPWKSGEANEILGPWLDGAQVAAARQAGLID